MAARPYWSAYVGDTISLKRMTLNAGLRYDRQSSSVLPSTEPAFELAPDLLPEIIAPGRRRRRRLPAACSLGWA